MVRTLLKLVAFLTLRRIPLAELAGATAVIVGLVLFFGAAAGWIAVGVALLLKSLEWDMARSKAE